MRHLKLLVSVLVAVGNAFATTYYVSPRGSDVNAGTRALPFRTVAKGVAVAVAGDTVILRDGVYGNEGYASDGSGCWHGCASPVYIRSGGTPEAWITLKAENKGAAILDCGTAAQILGCDSYFYLQSAAAYWLFQDLVFTRAAFQGLGTNEGASHIAVKGCRFEFIGNWNTSVHIGIEGIWFDAGATDWWIEGNIFHDIGRTGGLPVPNHDHGIYGDGSNVTIINNVFYNNSAGWGIQAADPAHDWLIANNTFAFSNSGQLPGQIVLWQQNGGRVSNITIVDNIFYHPSAAMIYTNISTIVGCLVDNNTTDAASVVKGSPCAIGQNNRLKTDPGFINSSAAPYNFHLQSGSVAIAAGASVPAVTVDFDGALRPSAPSIGAYEGGLPQGELR